MCRGVPQHPPRAWASHFLFIYFSFPRVKVQGEDLGEIGAIGGFKCTFGNSKESHWVAAPECRLFWTLRVYVFGELFQLTDSLQSMLHRGYQTASNQCATIFKDACRTLNPENVMPAGRERDLSPNLITRHTLICSHQVSWEVEIK